jgi:hypothetical protein
VAGTDAVAHSKAAQREDAGPEVENRSTAVHPLLRLQKQAGNRVVTELLRRAQAQLVIGAADDPHEAEADRIAAHVSRLLGKSAPRHTGAEGAESSGEPPRIRRQAPSGGGTSQVSQEADAAIASARGGGKPLAPEVRAQMESAFGGADFSGVRLHSGPEATQLNREMSARAFTVGSDIFFEGAVPGRSPDGNSLLAHELTHTIQQGASAPNVQRKGKAKAKSGAQGLDPVVAQQVSRQIASHPTMAKAEALRDQGDEDGALALLENFWDTESVKVKFPDGHVEQVKLSQFKPLMFTPSERRVIKNRKWRVAVAMKGMWDTAVKKGQVKDPTATKGTSDSSGTVAKVSTVITNVGSKVTTIATKGATIGGKVELEQATELAKQQQLLTVQTEVNKEVESFGLTKAETTQIQTALDKQAQVEIMGPKQTLGQEITTKIKSEWGSMTSTSTTPTKITTTKFKNQGQWASGIISIIGDTVGLVSSVTSTIALALDKKATKADVAAKIHTNLSKASTTADGILKAIQDVQGSELTTNMFHWVPGLSVFSSGFAAIGSAVSLVQRAYRVFKVDQGRAKTTAKEDEDLLLAMERVWVRAVQQVEQDAFATAKALTNTGLAIAEVATAGGFGIPKLAQTVLASVGYIHSFGHAIADSVRAMQTKDARKSYFGAKTAGSAEKLIRNDPWEAAHAIVSRAAEGDVTARELLEAFNVKLPALQAPSEKLETVTSKGKTPKQARMTSYEAGDVDAYSEAVETLAKALSVSDEPETLWDKLKSTVTGALKTPGQFRDRYRQAKRVAEVRNKQGYKGKSDRGFWWAFKYSGLDDKLKKVSERTEKMINEAFDEDANPKNKAKTAYQKISPFKVDSQKVRDDLIARVQPEQVLRAKAEQGKQESQRPTMEIIHPTLMPVWDKAMKMSFGTLHGIIEGGKKASGMSDDDWLVLVTVYARRLPELPSLPTPQPAKV